MADLSDVEGTDASSTYIAIPTLNPRAHAVINHLVANEFIRSVKVVLVGDKQSQHHDIQCKRPRCDTVFTAASNYKDAYSRLLGHVVQHSWEAGKHVTAAVRQYVTSNGLHNGMSESQLSVDDAGESWWLTYLSPDKSCKRRRTSASTSPQRSSSTASNGTGAAGMS